MNLSTFLYTLCVIIIILNFAYYKKRERPLAAGMIGMTSGIAVLIPLHYILAQFQVVLAINYFTVLVSVAFGIPGVIGMLVYSLLW